MDQGDTLSWWCSSDSSRVFPEFFVVWQHALSFLGGPMSSGRAGAMGVVVGLAGFPSRMLCYDCVIAVPNFVSTCDPLMVVLICTWCKNGIVRTE